MKRRAIYLTISWCIVILFASSCAVTIPVLRTLLNIRTGTLAGTLETAVQVENITIDGPAEPIPIRMYRPEGAGHFPILIYLHGGGWVFGSLDQSDNVCRYFSNKVGCLVISVDYRLAPKHKFPAAVEDAYCATQWAAENAKRIKGDPARIAIGGASAGGNLAAAVCLMARDRGGPSLVFQLLAYPPTNIATLETASYRDFAKGHGLAKSHVKWFRKQYLKNKEDARNPYASPLLAKDFTNLPPTLVITAEFDVLRDEGEAYAERLKREGIAARYIRYADKGHAAYWQASSEVGEALHQAAFALEYAFSQ
jgi:acetyl esterase